MNRTEFSFSFVIPVLNGQEYMADCLEHIMKEMGSNDEIIVADNGSTDATLEIVGRYPKVQVVQAPNITIGATRNRGAALAKGEILAFVDSDCLVCEGWRAAAVEILTDLSVAATGSHFDVPQHPTWIESAWIPPRKASPQAVHYIPTGNLIVRRSVFRNIGGFNETLVTDEDTDIGDRLNRAGLTVIDHPRIRAIHMGNPRTLRQFARKERWHATNILNTISVNRLDKPMVLTFVFMAGSLFAVGSIPLVVIGEMSLWWPIGAIGLAPLATALYRSCQWRRPQYYPHQVLLYAVFYAVRSIRIVEVLAGKMTGSGKK